MAGLSRFDDVIEDLLVLASDARNDADSSQDLVDFLRRENERLRTENKGDTQSDLRTTVQTLQSRLDGETKILDEQNIKLTKYAKRIEDLVDLAILSDRAYHKDKEYILLKHLAEVTLASGRARQEGRELMEKLLLKEHGREVESLMHIIRTLEEKIEAFEKEGREARKSDDVLDSENVDLKGELDEVEKESSEGGESEGQESEAHLADGSLAEEMPGRDREHKAWGGACIIL
jgi:hypothetical protein